MNKTLISIFFFLCFNLFSIIGQEISLFEVVKEEVPKSPEESFNVKLQIESSDADHYFILATIELNEGSFIVSPFSQDTIYGHFEMRIDAPRFLNSEGQLSEVPKSKEEYDPILKMPVKFVRETTMYKQKIKVHTKDDFEVSGLIWFVLEPSCVPFDITFTLTQVSGQLAIQKTKTTTSKGYYKP